MNVLRRQRGVTLVETLLAAAILIIVVTTTLSVLFVAEASGRTMLNDVDTSQQLRAAMRQIADDLTFSTKWQEFTCDPTGGGSAFSGTELKVMGQMPLVPSGVGPGDGWPGTLLNPGQQDSHCVVIQYKLVGDMLIREVWQHPDSSMIFATQVLATGLMPNQGQTGSYFSATTGGDSQLATVVLRMQRPGEKGGPDKVDEVSAKFFLP